MVIAQVFVEFHTAFFFLSGNIFLYLLKTSENHKFSDIYSTYCKYTKQQTENLYKNLKISY